MLKMEEIQKSIVNLTHLSEYDIINIVENSALYLVRVVPKGFDSKLYFGNPIGIWKENHRSFYLGTSFDEYVKLERLYGSFKSCNYKTLAHHGVKGMKWGIRKEYKPHPRKKTKRVEAINKTYGGVEEMIPGAAGLAVTLAFSLYRRKKISEAKRYTPEGRKEVDRILSSGLKKKKNVSENDMSSVIKDLKSVNPSRGIVNCVGCSIDYDLRRRGYDTTVMAYYSPELASIETVSKMYKGAKLNRITASSKKDQFDQLQENLNSAPDMSRGIIGVAWENDQFMYGHAIAYEKIQGKIRYLDPQSGKEYKNAYADVFSKTKTGKEDGVIYVRTDDRELIINEVLDEIVRNR